MGGFSKRLGSMLRVDLGRMFKTRLFYILFFACLVMPVLILVMTTMTDGAAFGNAWQIIATASGDANAMAMDLTGMCNINLVYFLAGVFVCLFVSEDFKSGYVKNLFTVRPRKGDYAASKTLTGFAAGALFLLAFFVGSVLGGAIAGLPFALGAAGVAGLELCMLSKIFLMGVFVAIFLLMSVLAKEKTWLAVMLSLFAGMLLFMMIPMLTPLDAGAMNLILCLGGGVIFAAALGCVSKGLLRGRDLV